MPLVLVTTHLQCTRRGLRATACSIPLGPHVESAVRGLRQAGQADDLPRALLTRAWLRSLQGDPAALNRALRPLPKTRLAGWYQSTILSRLLPMPHRSLSSQRFWDHLDYLDADALDRIEKAYRAWGRELTPDLPAHLARIAIGLEQVEADIPVGSISRSRRYLRKLAG